MSSPLIAYTLIRCHAGKEMNAYETLKSLAREVGDIKEIALLYGMYDIVLRIESENTERLKEIIFKIRGVDGVTETYTFLAAEREVL